MECAEIRNAFVAGRIPDGSEVELHLTGCGECRMLFEADAALGRTLAEAAPGTDDDFSALLARTEAELRAEVGPRAWLRSLPWRLKVAAVLAVALAGPAFDFAFHRRADFASLPMLSFWTFAALLGVSLLYVATRLGRGLSRAPRGPSDRALSLSLFALPALALCFAPGGLAFPASDTSWGHPLNCFTFGVMMTAPVTLLLWSLERRSGLPSGVLLLAGALAGLSANLLLHAHCGSRHPWHLLTGHASIGAMWALGFSLVRSLRLRAEVARGVAPR